MGLLDALRARTRRVEPNLDSIFALPSAAVTLESACALAPSGEGAVCFKIGTGAGPAEASREIDDLLGQSDAGVTKVDDELGFTWLVIKDPDLSSLVTKLHAVNSTLSEHGLGEYLLCAVVGFRGAPGVTTAPTRSCYLVYLFKRGTFYPFAPTDGEHRDNELELRVRADVAGDLPIEADLSRWMALWGLPVA